MPGAGVRPMLNRTLPIGTGKPNREVFTVINQMTLRRHADLVDRMATTLGLDLEELTMAGQLRFGTISDAVLNCTGCANTAGCERWLAMQDCTASETPDMCRNADLFRMLKAGKSV